MKSVLIFIVASCCTFQVMAQNKNYFLNSFTAGSSLTYIWFNNRIDYPVNEHLYEEYTWNINFAASIGNRMNVGLQAMNIFTSGTHVDNQTYRIFGAFAQYDFFWKTSKRTSLVLEASINTGDYCNCGHLDPYRVENLWYFGLGGGTELPLNFISERLFLDLAFFNYITLNDIKTKYNYTQYIIGINYKIGKLKK